MKTMLAAGAASLALVAASHAHAAVQSVSRIAFGPPGVLFVADWKGGEVHALQLPPPSSAKPSPFNLMDAERKIEGALGARSFYIEDLKARPGTGDLYLSIIAGASKTPRILVVDPDGKVRTLDLTREAGTPLKIRDVPTGDLKFWGSTPERSLTISDMRWHDGKLYMAGLSNQTFASSLRIAAYPFNGQQSLTTVAMFHTSHDQTETRAPIRAMTFLDLNGVDYLVAAYMCTPIVAVPVSELTDGAHVTGKTIAELGYGNTPRDMVVYSAADANGKTAQYLTVTNINRNAETMPVAAIAQAVNAPGLTKSIPWGQIVGPDVAQSPIGGAIAIDNLDDNFFAMARRNPKNGELQLVTVAKGYKLRISDYISEYDFPSYSYPAGEQTQYIKPIEDKLMRQEGHTGPYTRNGASG